MHLSSPHILPHRRDSIAELRQHGEWAAGCNLEELSKLRSRAAKDPPVAPPPPLMYDKVKANHRTCALEDAFAGVTAQLYGILDAQAQSCTDGYRFPVPTILPLTERPSPSEAAEIMKRVLQQVGANKKGVQLRFVLKQLWTDAILSPDFHISRTDRYGSAELDIVASRDLEPGEVVDSLRGYNLKLCGPEETVPEGFNELLTFEDDDTGNVSIGLGPLRILNHSCDPNSEWVQEVASGKTTPLWSVRTLCAVTRGEPLLVRYNDDIFGIGNWRCKCDATHLHGPPIPEMDDGNAPLLQTFTPTTDVMSIEPAATHRGVTPSPSRIAPLFPPSPAPTDATHGEATHGDKRPSTPFHSVFEPVTTPLTPRSPTSHLLSVEHTSDASSASTRSAGPELDDRLMPVSIASGHLAATSSSNPVASSSSRPVASSSLIPQSGPMRGYRRLVIDLTRDEQEDNQDLRPRRGGGLIIDLIDDEPPEMPGSSTTIIDLTGDDFEDDGMSMDVEILRVRGLTDLDVVIEDHAVNPEVGILSDSDLDELECDVDDTGYMEWSVIDGSNRKDDPDVRPAELDGLGLEKHPRFSNRPPIPTSASRAGRPHPVLFGSRKDALDLSEGMHRLSMDASWVKRRWRGQTVYDLSEEAHLSDGLGDGIASAKRRKL